MTVWKANIEVTIPKKHRLGSKTQSDKAWDRFHELVMQAIVKHVDFAVVKCVIIASPASQSGASRAKIAAPKTKAMTSCRSFGPRCTRCLSRPSSPP